MRVRRILFVSFLLVIALAVTGCTTFVASGLQQNVVLNGQKYEKLGDFTEKEWTNKFLGWGVNGGTLFNLTSGATDPKVRSAIEKNIKKLGGDAATDVKIKYGSNPLQWILTAFTGFLWVPGTVTVSGTVLKAVN